jgi:hypothetical protein
MAYGGIINEGLGSTLVAIIAILIAVYYFLTQGEKGVKYFVRRVPGVDAIDEALERATEMGGTVYSSIGDRAMLSGEYVDQAIAGLEIVEHVSRHCARLKTNLIVAIMGQGGSGGDLVPIHREVVRNAYELEGRLEEYRPEIVRYLGGDRYGHETRVVNIFKEEKVVSNILIGAWAGSLPQPTCIANSLGIVNITGTARLYQMFLQACIADYFLFGEEIFVAGAVLSDDPAIAATLRYSHYSKIICLAAIIIGNIIFWTTGSTIVADILSY